jgi:RhtB (resistance to homoserine/threonine) family protein
MELALAIGSVLGSLAVGVVSPGPSFIFVARTSVAISRRDGLAASAGMGVGGVIFAGLALVGLQAALAAVPWLFATLKAAGALYLIYLGVCTWRGAKNKLTLAMDVSARASTLGGSFRRGLLTQLSNPKTAVVYGSVFAAALPRDLPWWAACLLPVLIFTLETGWYSIVALVLSSASPRAAYLDGKTAIDRIAGGVMAALGLKLLWNAKSVAT